MEKDNFTGQKSISQVKTIMPINAAIPIMELVRFFIKEHYDSPHECSKYHVQICVPFQLQLAIKILIKSYLSMRAE